MNILKKHCCLCIHQFKKNGISYCKKFKYLVIPEYIYPEQPYQDQGNYQPYQVYKIPEYHIDTVTCRKEEELCGKKGNYFENNHY
jgi:hypothetical protein